MMHLGSHFNWWNPFSPLNFGYTTFCRMEFKCDCLVRTKAAMTWKGPSSSKPFSKSFAEWHLLVISNWSVTIRWCLLCFSTVIVGGMLARSSSSGNSSSFIDRHLPLGALATALSFFSPSLPFISLSSSSIVLAISCVCQNFQWAQIYLDRTCTYHVVVHECPCWTMPASSEAVVAMDHSRADGLNNQIYKGEKQWLHQHQTRACFCNMLCMMCFKKLFMLIIFFPVWKFDYYLHITWSGLCYYIYHYQSWKRQKNIFQIFFIWKNLFSVLIHS